MVEEWRDVKGYEGFYEVSNFGQIRNAKTKRIKKSFPNRCGYLKIQLLKRSSQKNFYVHRLVAVAFIPNEMNLKEVNHKDENKLNNRMDNLEWCDRKYNVNYGNRLFLFSQSMKNHPKTSKKIKCFDLKGNHISTFLSASEASRQTKIPATSIRGCAEGNLTHAGGFKWEYQ